MSRQSGSAGKRGHGRTRKGNRWIRRGLTQSALGASHSKDTYLSSFYWRIASKRGGKKARIAAALKQLEIAFRMIRDGVQFKELGQSSRPAAHGAQSHPRTDC